MQVEALGVVVLVLGCLGWLLGPGFTLGAFVVSTVLGASAGIILTSLGSASIQPAYLLLGFVVLAAAVERGSFRLAARSLRFPNEGFWLALTAAYVVLSAVLLPRIFAGATNVFAVARTEIGPGIVLMPLGPVSGNITQTIYFIGDLLCFLAVYIHAASPPGFRSVVDAVLACAVVNLLLAGVDVSGWAMHADDPLAFLRNANYRMLDEATMSGFKRIVGSFPETSAFAYFTLGQFAFCTSLWLSGIRSRVTCPLAALSLLALLFATSSTGYAGAAGFLIIAFAVGLGRMLTRPVTRQTVLFVLTAPLVAVTLLLGLRLDHASWQMLQGVLDSAVLDKLSSYSGIERGAWTRQALVNFFDTYGLGGGTGSVRASSFPIAVLGNIGAFGAFVYGGFMLALFCRRAGRWDDPYPAACQSAARWACLTLLIGASVAGSFVDLGLPFFIFAALACAGPAAARLARPRPAPSAAAFPLAGVRS